MEAHSDAVVYGLMFGRSEQWDERLGAFRKEHRLDSVAVRRDGGPDSRYAGSREPLKDDYRDGPSGLFDSCALSGHSFVREASDKKKPPFSERLSQRGL